MSAPVARRTALISALLAASALTAPALAASLPVAPVNTNTQAAISANGTPVVNIAAPNAAGLSVNQYTQFNVDNRGLVLNNGGAAQTSWSSTLAGRVAANPNLTTSGSATVILNEVVSANRSTLAGYTEVVGQKADVIVANPYGITINGAGFLNTPSVTLTTGTPVIGANGSLTGFTVKSGDIAITGQGLDATQNDYLALITRALTVDAQINAHALDVVAGVGTWDYASQTFTGGVGDANQPTVAIDSSALGGMYADRIRLIATEAGVGVRLLGGVAANTGQLSITAAGQIAVGGQLSAATTLSVATTDSTAGAISLTDAQLLSGGDTSLTAANGGLTLTGGVLSSGGGLALTAASLTDNGDAASITNNNQRYAAGAINLTIGGAAAFDKVSYTGATGLTGLVGGLAFGADGGVLSSNAGLTLNAASGDLALGTAAVYGVGDVSLTASKGAISTLTSTTGGVESSSGGVTLTGALNNAGTVFANGALTVSAPSVTDSGVLEANGALTIQDASGGATAPVTVLGQVLTNAALSIKASTLTVGAAGLVQSTNGAAITATSLDNAGDIEGALTPTTGPAAATVLTIGGLTNRSTGLIYGAGALTLISGGPIDTAGAIQSVGDLTIAPASSGQKLALTVESTGLIQTQGAFSFQAPSGSLDILAAGNTQGQILANTAKVSVGELTDAGLFQSTGAATLTDAGTLTVSGVLTAGGVLTLTAGATVDSGGITGGGASAYLLASLTNSGVLTATTTQSAAPTITVAGAIANSATGVIQSAGGLTLTSGVAGVVGAASPTTAIDNEGTVLAQGGDLTVVVTGTGAPVSVVNGAAGYLQASGAVTLSSPVLAFTNSGVVYGGAATLNAASIVNTGTVQTTGKALSITSAADFTNAGTLVSAAGLTLVAPNVVNTGGLQAATGVTLTTATLDNAGTFIGATAPGSSNTLSLTSLKSETGSVLQYAGDLDLEVTNLPLVAGTIYASGDLTLNSPNASVTLRSGGIGSGGALMLTLNNLTVNASATLAGDSATVTLNSLDNQGTVSIAKDASFVVANKFDNEATVYVGGGLHLTASDFENDGGQTGPSASGLFEAVGASTLAVSNFSNNGVLVLGALPDGSDTGVITASNSFSTQRSSTLESTGALTVTLTNPTATLSNAGTILAGGDLNLLASSVGNNTTGLLQAGGTLTYAGAFSTQSGTIAAQTLTISTPGDFTNSGVIQGGSGAGTLNVAGDFTNNGTVLFGAVANASGAYGSGVVTAYSIANNSKLESGGDLTLYVNGYFYQDPTTHAVTYDPALLINGPGAEILAVGALTMGQSAPVNPLGIYNSNLIQSGGALNANFDTLKTEGAGAALISGGDMTLAGTTLELADGSSLQAGGVFTINAQTLTLDGENARIVAYGTGQSSINTYTTGPLFGSSVFPAPGSLTNPGLIYAGGNLQIYTLSLNNQASGAIASGDQLSINSLGYNSTAGAVTNAGSIYAADLVDIEAFANGSTAAVTNTVTGTIRADAVYGGKSIINATIFTNQNALQFGGDITITAPTFTNSIAAAPVAVFAPGTAPSDPTTFFGSVPGTNPAVFYSLVPTDINSQLLYPTVYPYGQSLLFSVDPAYTTAFFNLASKQTGFTQHTGNGSGLDATQQGTDIQEYYYDTFSTAQTFSTAPSPTATINAGGTLTINSHSVQLHGGVADAQAIAVNATGGAGASIDIQSYPLLQNNFTLHYETDEGTGYNNPDQKPTLTVTQSTAGGVPAGFDATYLNAIGFNTTLTGCATCSAPSTSGNVPAPTPVTADTVSSATAIQSVIAAGAGVTFTAGGTVKSASAASAGTATMLVSYNNAAVNASALGLNVALPTSPNGFFVVSSDPNSRVLVESNPLYTSTTQFDDSTGGNSTSTTSSGTIGTTAVDSDYLAALLGYNPDQLEQRLGDGVYEQQLISQQLVSSIGTTRLYGADSTAEQTRVLYQQAAGQAQSLGLTYGQALTDAQQNALSSDIVWMVSTVVQGHVVLTPVVYLSDATRSAFDSGSPTIRANEGNLQLASLTNNGGALVATDVLSLSTTGAVNNNAGLIQASYLTVNSGTTLANAGTIKGVTGMALTATGDITNAGNISSANGSIESTNGSVVNSGVISGGNMAIIADNTHAQTTEVYTPQTGLQAVTTQVGGAVTNDGGAINVTGNLGVKAAGDVNNLSGQINGGTVQIQSVGGDVNNVTNRNVTTAANGDYSTSFGATSGITSTGALTIVAAGDINNANASLKSGGDAALVAGNNINITAQDAVSGSNQNSGGSSNVFSSSSSSTSRYASTEHGSDVQVGGDLYAQAGKDVNINASNVSTNGEADLVAANNVNITAGQNQSQVTTTTKSSNWFGSSSDTHTDSSTTNVASNVNAGKLYVSAGDATTGVGDVNIQGSNVNVVGSADIQAGHNVNVIAGQNTQSMTDVSHSSGVGVNNGLYGDLKETKTDNSTTNVASNLSTGGQLYVVSGNDVNITGSNVNGGGGGGIQAAHNINVTAGQNTHDITDTTVANTVLQVGGSGSASGSANAGATGDANASADIAGLSAGAGAGGGAGASASSTDGNSATASQNLRAGVNGNNQESTTGVMGAQAQVNGDANVGAQAQIQATGGVSAFNNTITHSSQSSSNAVGSNVHFGGDGGVMIAGGDVNVKGSSVSADKSLGISATNINITAAQNTTSSESDAMSTGVGLIVNSNNQANVSGDANASGSANATGSNGSASAGAQTSAGLNAQINASSNNDIDVARNTYNQDKSSSVTNVGSSISGGTVTMIAKNNLNVIGSDLSSTGDMGLQAKNMTFAAAQDTTSQSATSSVTGVGYYADTSGTAQAGATVNAGASAGASAGGAPSQSANAGASATANAQGDAGVGAQVHNDLAQSGTDTSTARVSTINVGGTLTRVAGDTITDVGTQVATGGDFNQSAKTFNSLAAANTVSDNALTTSATIRQGLYGDAGANAQAGASAGTDGNSAPSSGAGAGAEAGVGASNDVSANYTQNNASQAVVSNYSAGGAINTYTSGTATLEGSNLASNGGVNLYAGTLNFKAAHNTTSNAGTAQSVTTQANLGVDAETDIGGGGSLNYSGSEGASTSSQAVVGSIASNGPINIQTKNNATLEGTQLSSAGDVNLNVGGNLNYKSAYDSNQAIGGSQTAQVGATVSGKTDSVNAQVGAQVGMEQGKTAEVGGIAANGNVNIYSGGAATFEGTQFASGGSTAIEAKGPVSFNAAQTTAQSLSAGANIGGAYATNTQKVDTTPITSNSAATVGSQTAANSTGWTSATPTAATPAGKVTIGANRGVGATPALTGGTAGQAAAASAGSTTTGNPATTAVAANAPTTTKSTLDVNAGINGSYNQSNTATASTITAGKGISVQSDTSDVNMQGTTLTANGPVQISAARNVNLTTADSSSIGAGLALSGDLSGSHTTAPTPATPKTGGTTTDAAAPTTTASSTTDTKLPSGGAGALTQNSTTPATTSTTGIDGGGVQAAASGSYATQQQGVTINGGSVAITAGNNVSGVGTTINSARDTTVNAGGNVSLTAAQSINAGAALSGSLGKGDNESNSIGGASLNGGVANQGPSIASGGSTTINSGGKTELQGAQIASNDKTTLNAVGGVSKSSVTSAQVDLSSDTADASGGTTGTSLTGKTVATNTGTAAKAAIAGQATPAQPAPVVRVEVGKPVTIAQPGQAARVTSSDGTPAPAWVSYSPTTGAVTANPPAGYTGPMTFNVNVTNTDGTTSQTSLNFGTPASTSPSTTFGSAGASNSVNVSHTFSLPKTSSTAPATTPTHN